MLTAFMGGLAIGNGLMAAYGHRVNNPARFYLAIEATIGLTGFLVVLLLPIAAPFIGVFLISMTETQGFLSAGRFIIACLFLLVPAIAMGATLPVMQKLAYHYDNSFIRSIARLYGWNTIGAVSGVLLAEFLLITFAGIIGTAAIASMFNLFVILIILKYFGRSGEIVVSKDRGKFQTNIIRYLAAAFLSGMLLLALEVIWFRYLLIAKEGTSVNFAIMLATVLIGIGLGGLLVSRSKLMRNNIKGVVFILPILTSLVTLSGFYLFQWYYETYIEVISYNTHFILSASILIFPTCLMSGMIFPLLGDCIYEHNKVTTSSSGYLTLVNTVGAAAGSVVASFYLLPELGIEKSMFIIIMAYIFISLFLIGNINKQIIAIVIVVITVAAVFPHGSVKKSFLALYSSYYPDEKNVLAFREGLNQTVAYLEGSYLDQPSWVRLVTNSFGMSMTRVDAQRYMRLYSYFPYLFPNKIEDVLQISYGVGNTAESVIMLPDMKSFDVVDMSGDILDLSSIIHERTGVHPLKDERTTAHVEDGRFFLQTTKNKYDLITAEPPPPLMAGVVNLYTQEYFQLIHDALKQDGVTTYWLPLHLLEWQHALAIIKGFCNVFKDCSLWNGFLLDMMLVGSKSGLEMVDAGILQEKWTPEMEQEFIKIGFDKPEQVFATFVGDYEYLSGFTKYVAPAVDNYPNRIVSHSLQGSGVNDIYRDFLNITRRKQTFTNSSYINEIFSPELTSSIVNEFSREGIITSLYGGSYHDVLVEGGFNVWEMAVSIIPGNRKDFVALGVFGFTLTDMEIMDEVFKSESAREAYRLEYIKYLLIENKYELMDAVVEKVISDQNVDKSYKYQSYRYYLLSKLIQNTAQYEDLVLARELASSDSDNVFNAWYLKKLSE